MRAVVALFLAIASLGASAAPGAPDEPPARVGRVSWIGGEVAIFTDPERGWEKAYVNSPLTSENSLWTEPGARAEVRIGPTTLRLGETTQLDVRRLDDEQLRAHVVRGHMTVHVRELDRGERFLLSTPQARFTISAPGRYRIDADDATGESVLTVFNGSAEVEAGRRAAVNPGDAVRVHEDGEQFDFERLTNTPLDDWSASRDQAQERAVRETTRYVSPYMTGYEDLDQNGRWSTEPDYGPVWYPAGVAVDYVPYRDGRWVHTRAWGWTWVDNAPWGYAPFHYGRWVYVGNRWGWCPGRYVARPVWAPALVGWVGGGSGLTVAIGSGRAPAMGWYPLSPWDHYRPWYTSNARYINNVNVIVTRAPQGRDVNFNRDRGATVVLREDFVRQRPVAQGMTRVSGEAVREAVRTQPVATNPAQFLPPRTEVVRAPRGNFPAQVGGGAVAAKPFQQPAGAPAAPRVVPPAASQQAPGAPRVVPPGSQQATTQPGTPAAPRGVTPAPTQAAPGATRPAYGGEAVRAPQAQSQGAVQGQAVGAPQSAPAAPRPRPTQPVEQREERVRPAPQPQALSPGATRPPQAQPQQQPQAQPQHGPPQAEPVPHAKPAPAEKPAEKTDKDKEKDKEDKGRGRER